MKRLITSAFVSAALFAAATAMQRSPPTELSAATADRSSLQNPPDDLRVASAFQLQGKH